MEDLLQKFMDWCERTFQPLPGKPRAAGSWRWAGWGGWGWFKGETQPWAPLVR